MFALREELLGGVEEADVVAELVDPDETEAEEAGEDEEEENDDDEEDETLLALVGEELELIVDAELDWLESAMTNA